MTGVVSHTIADSVRFADGYLWVVSEVEVPEAPGDDKWLKVLTKLDPAAPVSLTHGPSGSAARLAHIYERIVATHHAAIARSIAACTGGRE